MPLSEQASVAQIHNPENLLHDLRVVVVSSDAAWASHVVRYLRNAGATVEAVPPELPSLRRARHLDPQLMILDPASPVVVDEKFQTALQVDLRLRWSLVALGPKPFAVEPLMELTTAAISAERQLQAEALLAGRRPFVPPFDVMGPARTLRTLATMEGAHRITVRDGVAEATVTVCRDRVLAAAWVELEGPATEGGLPAVSGYLGLDAGRAVIETLPVVPGVGVIGSIEETLAEAWERRDREAGMIADLTGTPDTDKTLRVPVAEVMRNEERMDPDDSGVVLRPRASDEDAERDARNMHALFSTTLEMKRVPEADVEVEQPSPAPVVQVLPVQSIAPPAAVEDDEGIEELDLELIEEHDDEPEAGVPVVLAPEPEPEIGIEIDIAIEEELGVEPRPSASVPPPIPVPAPSMPPSVAVFSKPSTPPVPRSLVASKAPPTRAVSRPPAPVASQPPPAPVASQPPPAHAPMAAPMQPIQQPHAPMPATAWSMPVTQDPNAVPSLAEIVAGPTPPPVSAHPTSTPSIAPQPKKKKSLLWRIFRALLVLSLLGTLLLAGGIAAAWYFIDFDDVVTQIPPEVLAEIPPEALTELEALGISLDAAPAAELPTATDPAPTGAATPGLAPAASPEPSADGTTATLTIEPTNTAQDRRRARRERRRNRERSRSSRGEGRTRDRDLLASARRAPPAEAIALYGRVLARSPNNATAMMGLARAHMAAGNADQAVFWADRAVSARRSSAAAWRLLGDALRGSGRTAAADNAYAQAQARAEGTNEDTSDETPAPTPEPTPAPAADPVAGQAPLGPPPPAANAQPAPPAQPTAAAQAPALDRRPAGPAPGWQPAPR